MAAEEEEEDAQEEEHTPVYIHGDGASGRGPRHDPSADQAWAGDGREGRRAAIHYNATTPGVHRTHLSNLIISLSQQPISSHMRARILSSHLGHERPPIPTRVCATQAHVSFSHGQLWSVAQRCSRLGDFSRGDAKVFGGQAAGADVA
jgi:hypothetical protein